MDYIFLGNWLGDKVLDGIASFFYYVFLTLNSAIYSFISFSYQIFLVLANGGKIFDDSIVSGMIDRLYVVLGVIVMFLVAYSLLKSMVNPDEGLKGKKSPAMFIKDILLSVVLIAVIPTVFSFAFNFQTSLLVNNVIGKLIVGPAGSGSDTIRNGGYEMSATVWQTFLRPQQDSEGNRYCDYGESEKTDDCKDLIINEDAKEGEPKTYQEYWDDAKENTAFWSLSKFGPKIISGDIQYIFIADIIAGIIVLIMLLGFNKDMAIRLVKLAIYEIMAPIPILARVVPGEQGKKVFSNWLKATVTTFVEVFIYIALVFFAVLLIATVSVSIDNLFTSGSAVNAPIMVKVFAKCLIIIGIILFTKQAPDIIKEITGLDGGKYNPFKSAMQLASTLAAPQAFAKNFNARNEDGSKKKIGQRFRSAFAGGASATARAIWGANDVKDLKSMRENRKRAAENAVKKRIERENNKAEKNRFIQDEIAKENERRREAGLPPINSMNKVWGAAKYKAAVTQLKFNDWAGIGAFNPITLERLQKQDTDFQNQWKSVEVYKNASYQKVKEEFEKANSAFEGYKRELGYGDVYKNLLEDANVYNQHLNDALNEVARDRGKSVAELNDNEKSAANERAKKAIGKLAEQNLIANLSQEEKEKYQTLKAEQVSKSKAKDVQTQIERTKKTDIISGAAKNMMMSLNQYSDVAVKQNEVLKKFEGTEKHSKFEEALKEFGDIATNDQTRTKFERALNADLDSKEYKTSEAFIDFLDELHKANDRKRKDMEREQQKRADTFAAAKKDDK